MKLHSILRKSGLLAAMTMTWMAAPASATDVDPGDYTALPPGTNMFLIYGQHIHRDELRTPDGGTLKSGTSLDTSVTLLRYVHFTKLGPFVVDPQIILPIGSVHNAQVGGQRLGKDTGLGDALIFATIWFVNKPGKRPTYVGFSPIIGVPTGDYDPDKGINFGNNRYTFNPQIGVIQGITDRILLDVYGDVTFYGDNNKVGRLHQTLKQHETYEVQSWLRFAMPDSKSTLSVGYAGYWGGRQYLDGVYQGQRTEHQQLRLAAQTMLTRSFQLEAIVARDVQARDGFREAGRFQLRLLKIF
ncbi:MAG: hypothetical protein BGP17_08760 [Sphingomonas sp. 67-41]|nr:MAG: hypothetical protein BGP17_08760 [Sphingomonas sp. 67-41]VVT18237.1 conserved exported hypothetical protein [Sphingomonas sp. EC-HK361]